MIKIGSYSQKSPQANCMFVTVGDLILYFSYETIVAFRVNGETICVENRWQCTTGKHLNWIEPDHKKRLKREDFEKQLNKMLKKHKL